MRWSSGRSIFTKPIANTLLRGLDRRLLILVRCMGTLRLHSTEAAIPLAMITAIPAHAISGNWSLNTTKLGIAPNTMPL
jgi:hypothetical protein